MFKNQRIFVIQITSEVFYIPSVGLKKIQVHKAILCFPIWHDYDFKFKQNFRLGEPETEEYQLTTF